MTLNECLQWAQRWAERINDDANNPYECYFESAHWLYCALSLASDDERQWVINCLNVVTMMVLLKGIKPSEVTFESDEHYHFKYRGLNEPDRIRRR